MFHFEFKKIVIDFILTIYRVLCYLLNLLINHHLLLNYVLKDNYINLHSQFLAIGRVGLLLAWLRVVQVIGTNSW